MADIFSEKNLPDNELYPFFKNITFKNIKPTVIGSFSLETQRNAGDIDLDLYITGKKEYKFISDEINKIIKNIDSDPKMFFIELKIQYKDGKKIKFYADEIDTIKIPENDFNKIEFLKIDTIIYYDGVFKELTINYWLNPNIHEVVKEIKENIKTELKEGNYYKVVKRFFSIAKVEDDKNKGLLISNFLNNYIGGEYKLLSNLKAIKSLLENYDDLSVRKMVRINLKNNNIISNIDVIYKLIPKLQKKVNKEGKNFLDKILLKK